MQAFAEKSRKREEIKEEKRRRGREKGREEEKREWRDDGGTVVAVPLLTPLRIGFLNNFSGERETG